MTDIERGIIVAVVSMVGTLIALGILALCIAGLHRFLPHVEEPKPAAAPAAKP